MALLKSVPRPCSLFLKGRSPRLLWGERTNERFLRCPPSLPPACTAIRDEPRLKMQICCRMQSAANQPAKGGSARGEGGQQMGPPQSTPLADYMASSALPLQCTSLPPSLPPLLCSAMLAPHLLINVRDMRGPRRRSSAAAAAVWGPLVELIAPEQKLAILQK